MPFKALSHPFLISLVGLIIFCFQSQAAEQVTISSTANPTTFLELYTSQGCSSCPPAERWISTFTDDEKLWTDLIPINFHVTYWDYLGWKDQFASAVFSKRQRTYKALGKSRIVATPGFMVNGKGWQGWFYKQAIPVAKARYSGNLKATINNSKINLEYDTVNTEDNTNQNLIAHVALLGFGIETQIHSGENAGHKLKHDFVVIGYEQSDMQTKQQLSLTDLTMPRAKKISPTKQALVFWVSKKGDPTPLQVAADWF
ncbi:hypothetical protein PL71_05460 [Pseudoalteromonas distincta]|uniref:DUF1223 domain-containing protein n=2 Tax=Pseudoalteromonas distincta TaxID=77608 RepID=A0ABT9G9U2_9GAMM|nr:MULTISPECIES: DUF1223 domain-containing protein [Pseudoalteromonas distincta group]KHM49919.1 hypothetical protein PL71_05460 [Pseudoalteromonas elyakovii]KID40646.1 hypothetical protein QT16_02205 [Pseudoalteromonas distincta]MDP4482633.1 DUF1223 domain-containing protein [Pseudoalteromonas elyakovii]